MSYLARIREREQAAPAAPIAEHIHWREHLLRLRAGDPPSAVSGPTWLSLIDGAIRFVDDFGAQAEALGWTASELFGLDRTAPVLRYDRRGAAFMLRDTAATAVSADTIAMRDRWSGTRQVLRKVATHCPPVWEWIGSPAPEPQPEELRA